MLAGTLAIGAMLWFAGQGFVLRATPDSWVWMERVTAITVGAPMWEAGQRIMAAAAPADFDRVAAADRLYQANAKAIEACQRQARKAVETVRCTVRVDFPRFQGLIFLAFRQARQAFGPIYPRFYS